MCFVLQILTKWGTHKFSQNSDSWLPFPKIIELNLSLNRGCKKSNILVKEPALHHQICHETHLFFFFFLNSKTSLILKFSKTEIQRFFGSLIWKVFKNPEPEEVLWFGIFLKPKPEVINKIKELHNTAQNFHRLYLDYCSFSSDGVSFCRRFCKTQNWRFFDSENVQKPGTKVFSFWRF